MTRLVTKLMALVFLAVVTLSLGGCGASGHYKKVKSGNLSGDLIVQWMKPDKFLFLPKESNPLTFVRADGKTIVPRKMFTDGGSIPRPLRALKNYSPWGYAPAFIVHDWLFYMQDCQIEGYEDYTVQEAALIMSEVMKTMMEDPSFGFGDKTTVYLMYLAVQTGPAKDAWNDHHCPEIPDPAADDWIPSLTYEISFEASE